MPRTDYCYSCDSEVERYEFTECKPVTSTSALTV
jgi:hypothetical protein